MCHTAVCLPMMYQRCSMFTELNIRVRVRAVCLLYDMKKKSLT